MADPTMRDVLDELATLRGTVEQQGARLTRYKRRDRRGRIARRLLPLVLAALLVALVPLATLAATPFTDLTGGPHDGNIDAIFTAGITKGCDATSYCPTANVTREEMASFLARTAGLGGNPPIANALTAQTATSATSAQTATNATNAGNANTLGGIAPSGLVRVARATRTTTLPLTQGLQTYLTVTIDAPAPGFVLLGGNVNFVGALRVTSNDDRNEYAMMYADLVHAEGEAGNNPTAAVATMRLLPGAWASVPLDHAFPVPAGRQTFHARVVIYGEQDISVDNGCIDPAAPCNVSARSATLTALYVPFGHNGGSTLEPTAP